MSVDLNDLNRLSNDMDQNSEITDSYLKLILFMLKEMKNDIDDVKIKVGANYYSPDDKIKIRKIIDDELVETKIVSTKEEIRKYIDEDIALINDRQLILNDIPRVKDGIKVMCINCILSSTVCEKYRVIKFNNADPMIVEYYFI